MSHYQQQRRGEELRPLRGPGGRLGDKALETVIVRLPPDVIAELDRVQGKSRRAETLRLALGIWASERIREREGAGAAVDALGRMAAGYDEAPYPKRKRGRS